MDNCIKLEYRKYTEEKKWHTLELENPELKNPEPDKEEQENQDSRDDFEEQELERFLCYDFKRPEGVTNASLNYIVTDPEQENPVPVRILDFNHNKENYLSIKDDGFFLYDLDQSVNRIKLVIRAKEGDYYSDSLMVKHGDGKVQKELIQMSRRVLESMPTLMLSVFQKSPLSVYLEKNSMIKGTIDTKLELIRRIIRVYHTAQTDLQRLPQTTLTSFQYVDRIEKMTVMDSSTLSFISQNPQYLVEIQKKKGIHYQDRVYLPYKTQVYKNVISYDIYENQYILSFPEMLIRECDMMKIHLELLIKNAEEWKNRPLKQLESYQTDFETLLNKSKRQWERVCKYQKELRKLKIIYRSIFNGLKDNGIAGKKGKPRSTAIFRQLPEYNIFYKQAFIPWFEYGVGDYLNPSTRAELYTTAIANPSTTYELYFIVRCLNYLKNAGYYYSKKRAKYAGIKENLSKYQDYSYEFVMYKDSAEENASLNEDELPEEVSREEITLFYSPSIFLFNRYSEYNADDLLYRNTAKTMSRASDESNAKGGAHYDPDFILKYRTGRYNLTTEEWENGSRVRFIMVDSKHKNYNSVVNEEMPALYNKYINSIDVSKEGVDKHNLNPDASIIGVCAIYNEHTVSEEVKEEEDYFEDSLCHRNGKKAFGKMFYLNVEDEFFGQPDDFMNSSDDIFEKIVEAFQEDIREAEEEKFETGETENEDEKNIEEIVREKLDEQRIQIVRKLLEDGKVSMKYVSEIFDIPVEDLKQMKKGN